MSDSVEMYKFPKTGTNLNLNSLNNAEKET